jgi:CRISPR-associated protein Csx10
VKAIIFSLHTQQPLLATSFQGDPNSDISYSFIPGSMIRGAIIVRYMKQRQLSELDLNNDEVKRLFFDANSTCYLNAYLLSQQGKRTLPVPHSWYKHKDDELPTKSEASGSMLVYDRAQKYEISEEVEPQKLEKFFWTIEDDSVVLYSLSRLINIHNQRDRKKGRSTQIKLDPKTNQLKGEGEIFRYEAINAGQKFQAVILCSNETDAKIIEKILYPNTYSDKVREELTSGTGEIEKLQSLWLGGSQSAGYGYTTIEDLKQDDSWNEIGILASKRTGKDNFIVTLISDLILRDEWGQYTVIPPSQTHQIPAPLTREIEKFLNVELTPELSYASSYLVGGFNRKWGLPLPQVPALTAGSVFVFKSIDITVEQIQELENQGIGERRVEGFGRIAINWLDESSFWVTQPDNSKQSNKPILEIDVSRNLAGQMADRLLQQKLEQTLQKEIGYLNIQGEISNSQLSRLHLIARQALSTGDCNLVISLLDNLPANAKGQFEKSFINNNSLQKQLEDWLKKPGSWIKNPQELTVTIADIERSITDEVAKENKLVDKYTLRLIMAVAKKAIKERN